MRYILILVGLGVIFSGGLFALSRMPTEEVVSEAPANSTDQQIPEERTHEVVLREDGFDPEEFTISAGDTIIFSTTRGTHFWPASNLHPTHDIYPAFDPGEPIPADATWSFTFEERGTWRMHDHLAPYFTGTVTVE